ncbi:MAG: alanine racemase, partial [Acidimicrobiia bacterium]|nr:alanine racemase [Acidimicrobiia bacterium]
MTYDTPCVTIDVPVMERNLRSVQAAATDAGVGLRPHIKTHKSTVLARLQLEAGAVGLTCATLSEAVGLSNA